MNMKEELKGNPELEVVGALAVAFTFLANAPYDSWGHEGTPAQMAAFIVVDAKKQGRFGFLERMVLGDRHRR